MSGYRWRGTQRLDPDPVLPKVGPRGGRPCGTEGGYSRHVEAREQPCQPCKTAHAKAKAVRRGLDPDRATGLPRTPVRCGTYAGAVGHRKRKEPVCKPCKIAEANWRREYEARRREAKVAA